MPAAQAGFDRDLGRRPQGANLKVRLWHITSIPGLIGLAAIEG
jgi:hypothetical protein